MFQSLDSKLFFSTLHSKHVFCGRACASASTDFWRYIKVLKLLLFLLHKLLLRTPTLHRIVDIISCMPVVCFIENPADFTTKLLGVVEGAKAGVLKYEEEFIVDRSANTLQLIIYLNGEKIRDHGVVKGDVEFDHTTDDGRQTRVINRLHFIVD